MMNFFKLFCPPSSTTRWQAQSIKQYGDFWMMGWSSMQTVFYRSLMIKDACEGKIDLTHPEFSLMSQEKFDAALAGTLASTRQFQRILLHSISQPALTPHDALSRMMDASIELMDVGMKPVHDTANANAHRLRTQARKPRARNLPQKLNKP